VQPLSFFISCIPPELDFHAKSEKLNDFSSVMFRSFLMAFALAETGLSRTNPNQHSSLTKSLRLIFWPCAISFRADSSFFFSSSDTSSSGRSIALSLKSSS